MICFGLSLKEGSALVECNRKSSGRVTVLQLTQGTCGVFLLQARGTNGKGCEGVVVSNFSISFLIHFQCLQEEDYERQSAVRSFSRQKNLNMAVINEEDGETSGKGLVCPSPSWRQEAETANN